MITYNGIDFGEIKMNERIIYLGTPAMSAYVLEGLVKNGFNIVAVITKEDKVRGRNNKVEESDVAKKARELSLPVLKPHKIKDVYEEIKAYSPDLLLTFAYGQIIPDNVLALSRYKPLNLHASLLPLYRGAAPIQYALRDGREETGVSLMEMIHEMDGGDVYKKEIIKIDRSDNYTSLCKKVQETSLKVATDNLPKYFEGKLVGVKQDESKKTFCPSIKKEEEHLDLALDKVSFVDQIRSLSLTPGGHLYLNDEIIKIYEAEVYSDDIKAPVGTIVLAKKKDIILQLKDGQIKINLLQRPGKKMMTASDFNNGVRDFQGKILR